MMDWDAVIHLPGLSLSGQRDRFGGGQLVYLGFDEWYAMDGSHRNAESKYLSNRPLFWAGRLSSPTEEDAVHAVLMAKASELHRLLLLHPAAPVLFSPALSCCYAGFDTEIGRIWLRLIGPAEREWIVFGGASEVSFSDADFDLVDDIADLLVTVPEDRRSPALKTALDVLERTAWPEYQFEVGDVTDGLSGFVEAVAACEGLVSEDEEDTDGDESLTAAFARRTADLFPPSEAAEHELSKTFGEIYSLRSRLIHGRMAMKNLSAEQAAKIMGGRRFLRNCCMAMLSRIAER